MKQTSFLQKLSVLKNFEGWKITFIKKQVVSLWVIIITVVRTATPLPSVAGRWSHLTLFLPEIPRSVIYKRIYTLRFTELDTFQAKKTGKLSR